MYRNIRKVLIANRGEITARIQRTLHQMGMQSVVVYAADDAQFDYISKASIAVSLGTGNLQETYLNQEKIIAIAIEHGVDAIHPGYGFLSENEQFAQKVLDAGIIWVGPDPEHIQLMGNKINARDLAKRIGIPVVETWEGTSKDLIKQRNIDFPVIAKPANGGGGKGMRKIHEKSELADVLERTAAEAERYFGDGTVYLEKYVPKARHIEVQVLADHFGNAIHLYERECTVQRRYQKVIEEAPAANLSEEVKTKLHEASLLLVKETGYKNAGTVEFIVDEQERFYFLEMNTRIQVEHPVTEEITGVDLVEQQINIAANKPLEKTQNNIFQRGHAIEVRLYAEDPYQNFIPSAGILEAFYLPEGKYRVDTASAEGLKISTAYDPMLAKIIVRDENRHLAINKLESVLEEAVIHGIACNKPLLAEILDNSEFHNGKIHTTWCDDIAAKMADLAKPMAQDFPQLIAGYILYKSFANKTKKNVGGTSSLWKYQGYWRNHCRMHLVVNGKEHYIEWRIEGGQKLILTMGDESFEFPFQQKSSRQYKVQLNTAWNWLFVSSNGHRDYYVSSGNETLKIQENLKSHKSSKTKSKVNGLHSSIVSPLPGKVIKIHAPEGTHVKKGDALLIIESMKMENKVVAVTDSTIKKVCVVEGQQLEGSEVLLELEHKTFSN